MMFKKLLFLISFITGQTRGYFPGFLPSLHITRSQLLRAGIMPVLINNNDESPQKQSKISNLPLNNDEESKIILHTEANKIYYTGSITQEGCFHLIKTINALQNTQYNNISLILQSPGGTLLPALGVVDTIENSKIPVYTYINGYAASAASVISVSGHKRFMGKNSLMLIHSIRMNMDEVNFNNLEDSYFNAVKMTKIIKNIYKKKSIISDLELEYLLEHDLWLNSEECLKLKLIDKIK
jgi:ATP-dependent Clp protease protease subunit